MRNRDSSVIIVTRHDPGFQFQQGQKLLLFSIFWGGGGVNVSFVVLVDIRFSAVHWRMLEGTILLSCFQIMERRRIYVLSVRIYIC